MTEPLLLGADCAADAKRNAHDTTDYGSAEFGRDSETGRIRVERENEAGSNLGGFCCESEFDPSVRRAPRELLLKGKKGTADAGDDDCII